MSGWIGTRTGGILARGRGGTRTGGILARGRGGTRTRDLCEFEEARMLYN